MAKGLPRSTAHGIAKYSPVLLTIPVVNGALTATAAAAGVGFGTLVIGDFPAGTVLFLGATSNFQFLTASTNVTNATYTGSYSVGTDPSAAGALSTVENNIVSVQTLAAATAKLSPLTRGFSAVATAPCAVFNNISGALEINLNFFVAAADITDATSAVFTVNGFLSLAYLMLP